MILCGDSELIDRISWKGWLCFEWLGGGGVVVGARVLMI